MLSPENIYTAWPDIVTHDTSDPRTWEAEAEGFSKVRGLPGLHTEFQATQGYTGRPYDSLNKNGPIGLKCLDIWSEAGRIVWEGLGCVALLEGVCHWWQDLIVPPLLVLSACNVKSQQFLPSSLRSAIMGSNPLKL